MNFSIQEEGSGGKGAEEQIQYSKTSKVQSNHNLVNELAKVHTITQTLVVVLDRSNATNDLHYEYIFSIKTATSQFAQRNECSESQSNQHQAATSIETFITV